MGIICINCCKHNIRVHKKEVQVFFTYGRKKKKNFNLLLISIRPLLDFMRELIGILCENIWLEAL